MNKTAYFYVKRLLTGNLNKYYKNLKKTLKKTFKKVFTNVPILGIIDRQSGRRAETEH